MSAPRAKQLIQIADEAGGAIPDFLRARGPGEGNKATDAFMRQLRARGPELLAEDLAEMKICGANSFAGDFYLPGEAVILEVALGLRNPGSEYEKDVLKAVMEKELGSRVDHLIFLSKLGAHACTQERRLLDGPVQPSGNATRLEEAD